MRLQKIAYRLARRHAHARAPRVGPRGLALACVTLRELVSFQARLLLMLLLWLVAVVAAAAVADALTFVLVRWFGSPPDHAGVGRQTREGAGSPLAEAYVSVGANACACLRFCVRVCVSLCAAVHEGPCARVWARWRALERARALACACVCVCVCVWLCVCARALMSVFALAILGAR